MSSSSLLLFWGLPLAQTGFSAFLQWLCSSWHPRSQHPPSHLRSGACKHGKPSQALQPSRLPMQKPKAWNVGAFRVSVLFTLKSQVVEWGDQRACIACPSCRCLVNNLREILGKPKGEGLWEAGSPKLSVSNLPLAWYSWKGPQKLWTSQATSLHGI